MAATRLIALHINKGKTVAQCLRERTDYAQNPEKTAKGDLVTGYQCDPMTVDEEFLLSKRQYQHITGKHQKHEVIAYQIRQSFKPGEITPEEANQVGYELAERFTKGKHAFIVATHTDRAHIHNHIIFNSTTLDCAQKFKDFYYSGLVIEKVPYSQRRKRTIYEKRTTYRDQIRQDIDTIMKKPPNDFDAFLRKLEEMGYEVKRGKKFRCPVDLIVLLHWQTEIIRIVRMRLLRMPSFWKRLWKQTVSKAIRKNGGTTPIQIPIRLRIPLTLHRVPGGFLSVMNSSV